jgi:hypothetical protein
LRVFAIDQAKEVVMVEAPAVQFSKLECCPTLAQGPVCDVLDFRYSVPYRVRLANRQTVQAEVILHFRLERCSGGLVLGDLAYTTTLLPGEQVRLFTSDRHTRWSYDAESQQTYRNETTSEESYFTWGMASAMSDLQISQSGSSVSTFDESWAQGGGGGGINLFGIVKIGGGSAGSYDATSTNAFAQSLSQHAQSSSSQIAAGVRARSSTAIGEAQQRTHAEGESEERIESSSRTFRNPNHCHAVTFLFYKLNKLQKIRFKLVAIERRIDDPAAPTTADRRIPVETAGLVAVRPQAVLATSKQRLEVERIARQSALERERFAAGLSADVAASANLSAETLNALRLARAVAQEPISEAVRRQALTQLDTELTAVEMLDPSGKPSERIIAELSWERDELLPTPGVLVKGCLDECSVCEPELVKERELDLRRKDLENRLLERRIELLEKSQEYRCCPAGEVEEEES